MVVEWIIGAVVVLSLIFIIGMYRIVPPSQAHFITSPGKTFVCSADSKVSKKRWYFAIPIFRDIRKMDLTIKELVVEQETYEKNQARYKVKSSIKYRIKEVLTAANTFTTDTELKEQLLEVVRASVRAITVKYDVVVARANKKQMSDEIRTEITDDLGKWGLELVNFQLIDFQDTEDSKIISDISRRREVEIQSRTREENAEKIKVARIKEAEATEKATEREIAKDKVIGEREQNKAQAIAEQEKIAQEKAFEVIRVQQIKQAEIDKDKAIVLAEQDKATEFIQKEKKKLEGEGDRLKQEEQAKGIAAPIREKGLAEAEAKEALQAALNKFKDEAIRALVAEKVVDMQKEVGIAGARALEKADVKVFAGDGAKDGFDLGKMISAIQTSNEGSAEAVMNYLARPNDLGLSALDLDKFKKPKGKTGNVTSEPKPPRDTRDTRDTRNKRKDRWKI